MKKLLSSLVLLFIGFTVTTLSFNISATNDSYYSDITQNLDSTQFKSTLNNILKTTHKTKLSYAGVYTSLKITDAYDENNIECIYTGVPMLKGGTHGGGNDGSITTNGKLWNREHVWAKSYGFPSESFGAYTDIHHLRASEQNINSTRGNLPFDEVIGGSSDKYGNSWTRTAFEPRDEVKGDVARMLFYMVVRYDDASLDLELVDSTNISTSTGNGKLGKLSTLLNWHYNDPINEKEKKRNEEIAKIQGNRNAFIDHPEYAFRLYKAESEAIGYDSEKIKDLYGTQDPEQPNDNQKLANAVIDKIAGLGEITSKSKAEIDEASSMYEALTDEQKKLVTNFDILQDAIKKYDSLKTNQTIIIISASVGGVIVVGGVVFIVIRHNKKKKE